MGILTQILISLFTSIVVVLAYFFLRKSCLKKNKASRTTTLEKRVSDMEFRVADLEGQITHLSSTASQQAFQENKESRSNEERSDTTDKQSKSQSTQISSHDQPQIDKKPRDATYTPLAISDGKLVRASTGQSSYYHAWTENGQILFEFNCDPQRIKKAINNRSAIIDPCCIKDEKSIEPDLATSITTVRNGELDNNYNIISKAKIKFS